jgi:hypothetical protein
MNVGKDKLVVRSYTNARSQTDKDDIDRNQVLCSTLMKELKARIVRSKITVLLQKPSTH